MSWEPRQKFNTQDLDGGAEIYQVHFLLTLGMFGSH